MKTMAPGALRWSIQFAMRSRQLARGNLRSSRFRDGAQQGRDEQGGNSHSSGSRVTGWHWKIFLHDANAESFEESVWRISTNADNRVVVRHDRGIAFVLQYDHIRTNLPNLAAE